MTGRDAEHDQLRESTGLYVLGALAPEERLAFEHHLAACAECSAEARALATVAQALPQGLPSIDPAPSLRNRVLAGVGGSETTRGQVVTMPSRPPARASRISSGWLSAAALLLVSVGVTGYAWSLNGQISDLQLQLRDAFARLDRSEEQVAVATRAVNVAEARMAVLTAPDLRQVDLQAQAIAPRASGRAFLSRTRGLVFTASDLPPLPAGRAYQLWVITTVPVSVGMLERDTSGRVAQAFPIAAALDEVATVAVTDEPEAGVPQPTGDMYLVGLTQ